MFFTNRRKKNELENGWKKMYVLHLKKKNACFTLGKKTVCFRLTKEKNECFQPTEKK